MAKKTDRELLVAWTDAWNDSKGMNPLGKDIDRAMTEKYGISIWDIHTRLGVIASIRREDRNSAESALFDFWLRTKLVAENALVDKCTESTQGSIFVLKARYGYKDGMELTLTDKEDRNTVQRTWGGSSADAGEMEGD